MAVVLKGAMGGATAYKKNPSAYCFVAGTALLTTLGYTGMECVCAGDYVYAKDAETGEQAYMPVLDTFENEISVTYTVTIDGESIETTAGHPFYTTEEGWVGADELEAGDTVELSDGSSGTVEDVERNEHDEPITIYNFCVMDFHTYYVGENEVLVHNETTCGLGDGSKSIKPEAAVTGSKKHGVNWKEGPARAKATGKPQGQWAKSDLDYATEMAKTLEPGKSSYFNLKEGAESIVYMPDGSIQKATKMWIRNNGTGTWHGYPMK